MTRDEPVPIMSELTPEADVCAREPIHQAGAIQPHGALVCLSSLDLSVLHTSINAGVLLGGPFRSDDGLAATLGVWTKTGQPTLRQAVRLPGGSFQLAGHRSAQGLLLEFEAVRDDGSHPPDHAYETLRRFMDRVELLSDLQSVAQAVAESVRRLTNFNRVLVYRFDADGNGTVIAEDGDGVLPSYLDLRFPASDIPAQARALYCRNRLRLIPDVDYVPVPLDPPISQIDNQPLDLSPVGLRSVSPVHLQYMRNMQTGASMSVSLVADGRLWGLIACHHRTSRWVSPDVRSTCDFLGQLAAQQIAVRQRTADSERRMVRKRFESDLLMRLSQAESFKHGLVANAAAWLALTEASGAAVVFDGTVERVGIVPSDATIKALADWLHTFQDRPVFVTDHLAAEWSAGEACIQEASGVLAISISQLHPGYILWFRQEQVRTVTWAGDPNKSAHGTRLMPRTSFEQWKEQVRGKSAPWQQAEIEAATDFRNAVTDFVLRHVEQRAAMAERLQMSNKELEAFSYSVSHDLRAPFRHIVGYAELLRGRESGLDPTSLRFLDTIRDAALSAGRLVDDLLAFSQLNRASLMMHRVDMNKVVAEARTVVCHGVAGDRVIDWRIDRLPEAWGDVAMIRQAMLNLLSNAVKYTGGRARAEIWIEGRESDAESIYTIRDNGIGFDMRYAGKLFGVFQRLHRIEDFEGTGIGLALTKRVIDRHGGWITAHGVEHQGATFTFALPRHRVETARA